MKILHEGHAGTVAMKCQARSIVYWPGIDSDIEEITKNCTECFLNFKPKGIPVSKWPETEVVWQRVHADWCGPVENHYFLVVIDSKSKFMDVHATKSLTAKSTIDCLRKTFTNFGIPEEIVVDNGPCFIAQEFLKFLENNRIKKFDIAPYHPQSNGPGERAVKTFKTLYNKFKVGDVQTRVCKVLYNYRATVNSCTGETPSHSLFGRNFKTAIDSLKPKTLVNRAVDPIPQCGRCKFKVGDAVFAKNFGRGAEWIPGVILEVINALNYKIKLSTDPELVWQRHATQLFQRQILKVDDAKVVPLQNYDIGSPAVNGNAPQAPTPCTPRDTTRSGRVSKPAERYSL